MSFNAILRPHINYEFLFGRVLIEGRYIGVAFSLLRGIPRGGTPRKGLWLIGFWFLRLTFRLLVFFIVF